MSVATRHDCILLDLDGVLYRGNHALPGARATVDELRAVGTRVAFVTNNSSRTPEQVAEKLAEMGIHASSDEVVTSALATADLLRRRGGGSAFVIGEAGIRKALADAGIEVLDGAPESADFVVVGWDRSADYRAFRTASLLVQRGSGLVATNRDASYPAPGGLWPGAGALLAVITTTTGAIPEVVGKPYPPLFRAALERAGGGRALVVGDRLDTDIAGAEELELDSLLVLTGVSGLPDLMRAPALPTFVGADLRAVLTDLPRIRLAGPGDAGQVVRLLEASGLGPGGVEDRLEGSLVAELDGRIVGTAAMERTGDDALLRSVAVDTDRRSGGLGSLLTARAVRLARDAGAGSVYLVTATAERFFSALGFQSMGTADRLPQDLRRLAVERDHCATSDRAMRLSLAGTP
jgi:HAD superfamily hydrolase (TIGR01457 family)